MSKFLKVFVLSVLFSLFATHTAFSQAAGAGDEWIEVRSDNGDFLARTPAIYDAFFDKDGFTISDGYTTLALSNVLIFNSFQQGTLISFESYDVKNPKKAAEMLREGDKRYGKFTDLKGDVGLTSKQIIVKNDAYYMVRQYIASKTNLYILTTASREGETKAMRHFLDSIEAANKGVIDAKSVAFSALKITPLKVEISMNKEKLNKSSKTNRQAKQEDPGAKKMVVVSKPRPYYTDAARMQGEEGIVEMRISFTANGGIVGLSIRKQLNAGLVRQCAFAAMRMKFLPPEKDGVPVNNARLVQYSFDIY